MDLKAELINNQNDDLTVVNAARVSFDKESAWDESERDEETGHEIEYVGPKQLRFEDSRLIKYLANHGHWTPFSHCRFTFEGSTPVINAVPEDSNVRTGLIVSKGGKKVRHSFFGWVQLLEECHVSVLYANDIRNKLIHLMPTSADAFGLRCRSPNQIVDIIYPQDEVDPNFIDFTLRETVPIFVARQRFKHTVDVDYNEVSRRYVSDKPEFYIPEVWRGKPTDGAKQGSSEIEVEWLYGYTDGPTLSIHAAYKSFIEQAEQFYDALIANEVAPEQARMVLPQSMMTSYYVTSNLDAWRRCYGLRIDAHSQKEIRDLAVLWGELIDGVMV